VSFVFLFFPVLGAGEEEGEGGGKGAKTGVVSACLLWPCQFACKLQHSVLDWSSCLSSQFFFRVPRVCTSCWYMSECRCWSSCSREFVDAMLPRRVFLWNCLAGGCVDFARAFSKNDCRVLAAGEIVRVGWKNALNLLA